MKIVSLKPACLVALVLMAAGHVCTAWAHDHPWTLGVPANIFDSYALECSTGDTAGGRLVISVKVTEGAALSLKVEKNGQSVTAANSETVQLIGGDGEYIVTVSKAAAGISKYHLTFHCQTATGFHDTDDTALKPLKLGEPGGSTTPPTTVNFQRPVFEDEVLEGSTIETGFDINHGCTNSTATEKQLPVIAQTMLFPNNDDSVAHKINADGNEDPISRDQFLQEFEAIDTDYLPLLPELVQSRDVFGKQQELSEGSRVRGFQSDNGKLPPAITGVTNFIISVPVFSAGSCAKSLQVRVGVLNYCSKSQDTSQKNRADVWIGHTTGRLDDPGVMPNDFETAPFWPTLTINRDLVNNPLDLNCGEGYELAVEPSEADIDRYLPIKGYWPK